MADEGHISDPREEKSLIKEATHVLQRISTKNSKAAAKPVVGASGEGPWVKGLAQVSGPKHERDEQRKPVKKKKSCEVNR